MANTATNNRDGQQMDDLLQKLRLGDVHRASKGRARQAHVGRLQRQSLSSGSSSAIPVPLDLVASVVASSGRTSGAADPGDQARGLLAQITGKDGVSTLMRHALAGGETDHDVYSQGLTSPTSPHFRVKRERRALKPLFPSNAVDLLLNSEAEPIGEESARSPEADIAEEVQVQDDDSASISGSDYSHEDDGESDADDGRSNFGLDSDDIVEPQATLAVPNGNPHDEDDEGDVTMRLRELSRTPSAETPNRQKRGSKDPESTRKTPEDRKVEANEDEDYLSELSEDEAFAASLA